MRRRNPDAALTAAFAYQRKMTEGPVTEEDIVNHRHLLAESKELLSALRLVRNLLPGDQRREFDDIVSPLSRFLDITRVAIVLIPAPQSKPALRLKLNPRRRNPGLSVYRLPIYGLDPRHNYVLVMPNKKQVWATFQAKSLKEAMRIAKSMRAETKHKVKLMRLP